MRMADEIEAIPLEIRNPEQLLTSQFSYNTQLSHGSSRFRRRTGAEGDSRKGVTGRSIKKSVADFFGVGDENPEEQEKWLNRSCRLASKKTLGGQIKPEYLTSTISKDSLLDEVDGLASSYGSAKSHSPRGTRKLATPYDPLHMPSRQVSKISTRSNYYFPSRQISTISTGTRRSMRSTGGRRSRKDSAFKIVYESVKSKSGRNSSKRKPCTYSRSFAPGSISSYHDIEDPDSLKLSHHSLEYSYNYSYNTSSLRGTLRGPSPRGTSDSVFTTGDECDDVFFDVATPTSAMAASYDSRTAPLPAVREIRSVGGDSSSVFPSPPDSADTSGSPFFFPTITPGRPDESQPLSSRIPPPAIKIPVHVTNEGMDEVDSFLSPPRGWRTGRKEHEAIPGTPGADLDDSPLPKKVAEEYMSKVMKSQLRRKLGMGVMGRLCNRQYDDEKIDTLIQEQLNDIDDHRPFFTYWVTFVQITIYIFTVISYGFAPIGFEDTEITGEVRTTNLALERVSYFEKDSFWLGPRQADMIHLGAKYSPCMRLDENVDKNIQMDRDIERESACCISNDGAGCYQSVREECSQTLATWYKFTPEKRGFRGRLNGSVCGQDPEWCLSPASSGVFKWPEDITEWPICTDSVNASMNENNKHMLCEVVGRPCCVGIQGQCIITTREYCDFRKGFFHEDAALCSQVECINDVCGMFPFLDPKRPDQFYRLWTSLFLHAGAFQLLVSVLFQYFVMRDLEKLTGWVRISIVFLGSGIAGSLASATFLPYHVEAGPAGAHLGMLGCLLVEVIQNWYILLHPWWALGKLALIVLGLFFIGLLPMVDNYAQLVGFFFGFLLSFALLPYVTFGKFDRKRKIIGVVISLLLALGLQAGLGMLFYLFPVYSCPNCHFFNCIPFTEKFCDSMEVEINRDKRS